MIEEEWRDIPGHEGYQITRDGRVRSILYIKPFYKRDRGYSYHLGVNSSTYGVGKLLAMAYVPNPDNLEVAVRLDGDVDNTDASNIVWMSRSDAMKHIHRLGIVPKNTRLGYSDDVIAQVKELNASGTGITKISLQLDIPEKAVIRIIRS